MAKKSKQKKNADSEEEWEDEEMDVAFDETVSTEMSQPVTSDPKSRPPPITLASADPPEIEDEIL